MKNRYAQLKIGEREQIAVLKAQGKSLREIAGVLGKDPSTVSRELKRNGMDKEYVAYRADRFAMRRKKRAARRKRLKNDLTRQYVHEKLKLGWSPEQIAGRIAMDQPMSSISHEAIYQYIYHEAKDLIGCLARRHKKRYRLCYLRKRKASLIPNRILITERPEEVNQRRVFGHWETDAMVSRASKAALNVLVERMSRYAKLTKLAKKSADLTKEAIVRRLRLEKSHSRLTITYDNGIENIHHECVNRKLRTKSYFCIPYHSWEKGTVENTIGLIRRFIPKKTDLARISTTDISQVERLLNNRPRKCLQYRTPKEVYSDLSGALPG